MNKKLIGSLLALTLVGGVATTSHAQAATARSLRARHDTYTAHAVKGVAAPSPIPMDAWNYAWNNFIGSLAAATRSLFGASSSAARGFGPGLDEKIFDAR